MQMLQDGMLLDLLQVAIALGALSIGFVIAFKFVGPRLQTRKKSLIVTCSGVAGMVALSVVTPIVTEPSAIALGVLSTLIYPSTTLCAFHVVSGVVVRWEWKNGGKG